MPGVCSSFCLHFHIESNGLCVYFTTWSCWIPAGGKELVAKGLNGGLRYPCPALGCTTDSSGLWGIHPPSLMLSWSAWCHSLAESVARAGCVQRGDDLLCVRPKLFSETPILLFEEKELSYCVFRYLNLPEDKCCEFEPTTHPFPYLEDVCPHSSLLGAV